MTNTLAEARDGLLQLVRITLKQAPYWQKLETEAKAVALAEKTLGTELSTLTGALKQNERDADSNILARLPVFLDTLPPSSSDRLLQQLHEYQQRQLGALK
eukprot:6457684-Amphidinium_carterae.1